MVGLVQVAPQAAVVVVEIGGDEAEGTRFEMEQLHPLRERAEQPRNEKGRGEGIADVLRGCCWRASVPPSSASHCGSEDQRENRDQPAASEVSVAEGTEYQADDDQP
ncbi:hypothetical protein D3C72_1719850 [compost metagenome]